MDWKNEKCVMILDESLPLGLIANTVAIMGITLGKQLPEVVGTDVADRSGNLHLGIIEFPVPILRGSPEIIKAVREKLYQPEFQELTVIDMDKTTKNLYGVADNPGTYDGAGIFLFKLAYNFTL